MLSLRSLPPSVTDLSIPGKNIDGAATLLMVPEVEALCGEKIFPPKITALTLVGGPEESVYNYFAHLPRQLLHFTSETEMDDEETYTYGDVKSLPPNLKSLSVSCHLRGRIAELPRTLEHCELYYQTLEAGVTDFPWNLKHLERLGLDEGSDMAMSLVPRNLAASSAYLRSHFKSTRGGGVSFDVAEKLASKAALRHADLDIHPMSIIELEN